MDRDDGDGLGGRGTTAYAKAAGAGVRRRGVASIWRLAAEGAALGGARKAGTAFARSGAAVGGLLALAGAFGAVAGVAGNGVGDGFGGAAGLAVGKFGRESGWKVAGGERSAFAGLAGGQRRRGAASSGMDGGLDGVRAAAGGLEPGVAAATVLAAGALGTRGADAAWVRDGAGAAVDGGSAFAVNGGRTAFAVAGERSGYGAAGERRALAAAGGGTVFGMLAAGGLGVVGLGLRGLGGLAQGGEMVTGGFGKGGGLGGLRGLDAARAGNGFGAGAAGKAAGLTLDGRSIGGAADADGGGRALAAVGSRLMAGATALFSPRAVGDWTGGPLRAAGEIWQGEGLAARPLPQDSGGQAATGQTVNITGNHFHVQKGLEEGELADALGRMLMREIESSSSGVFWGK